MRDPDTDLLLTIRRWLDNGHGVALATLARAEGRPPRPLGAMLALRDDGAIAGSVSGGCVEETLARDMGAGRLARGGPPQVVRFGTHGGRVERVALPCGGGIELVLEPAVEAGPMDVLLGARRRGERTLRRVCLATGEISLHAAGAAPAIAFDGRDLRRRFGPAWRLLVIGAGDLARCVAEMALALDAHVVVCDPRTHWGAAWDLDEVALCRDMPDEAFAAAGADEATAVLALTHDPALDDLVLAEALASPAFFVGALGSRRSAQRRRERLQRLGVPEPLLKRLRGPVGLPLGGRSVTEMALSILADVTAARYRPAAQSP